MMGIDNRKDYLLLLLYSQGHRHQLNEPIVGRTRLVKMLFLFKKEALDTFKRAQDAQPQFYEFFPWYFGPFSKQVYDDLKFFQLRGFVNAVEKEGETTPESLAEWEYLEELEGSRDSLYSEYVELEFSLTEKGCKFAERLFAELTSAQRTLLREFKARTGNVPLKALLKYVYTEYPDQTAKSKIKDNVLGR